MPAPIATAEEVIPQRRPYQPYGSALQLMRDRSPEILLSGPAGTGKTRANLEKLHLCANVRFPGMRGLIVRKTRASLTESALVTFETHVVEEGNPCLKGPTRAHRQSYKYANGSEIVCGGMDKASRTLSTEYDLIYIPEATELTEDDWEILTRPLRHGKMPFQQLIADTNPDKPTHWLKKRCDAGRTKLYESRHEENPKLWDMAKRAWTPFGAQYIDTLDRLTGPRKQRLRYGRWVQAEGVVYDGWDAAVHIIDPFVIPEDWPRYWAIDFGYTDSFVCLWLAQDPEGRLYVYRELHQTQRLVEDHAREMLALSANEPKPNAVICDHDREGRATLEKYLGMGTDAAIKDIQDGIQSVAARLRPAPDGKPRLFVLRDSLVRRDPALEEKKLPCSLVEEIDGYVWNADAKNPNRREEPVDKDNHSCDALRYAVHWLDQDTGLGDFVHVHTMPDPATILAKLIPPPPADGPKYPNMRFFHQHNSYQPWIDRDGDTLWLPDFRTEEIAGYALHLAHELLELPPPLFARPVPGEQEGAPLTPADAAQAERVLRQFLRK